ncbi:uncharacterized protein RAG0_10176 [Rhynchosporium agropyri]|uniref:F-box domain-containing protein n=1 Tax=Rhynchosporium agropyri TaxID=914238 RepID=A0A1E1KYU0_9HELO|nr:uncharacterized protein RAG0_10176 [Rhynchosporium agropyri]
MPPTRNSGTSSEISASLPKSRAKLFGNSRSKIQAKAIQDTQDPQNANLKPDKESNKLNAFLNLPIELKLQIVDFLPTYDIPSVRMISQSWAAAGAPSIFRNGFTVRPQMDDMDRLGQVCLRPEFAKGIRFIKFFAGDTDKGLLFEAVNREEQRLNWATGGQLTKVWNQIDAIFDSERMQKHCEVGRLEKYLASLPNLEAIKVTSQECPVRGSNMPFCILWQSLEEDFDESDDELAHFLNTDMSIQRYAAVLSAALKCKTITSIALDSFPIDYFGGGRPSLSHYLTNVLQPSPTLKTELSMITVLQISIVGRRRPYPINFPQQYTSDLGRKMAKFIGCFSNLRSLDLSYDESVDDTDECLMGFEEVFYRLKFPHLHSLLIAGCDSTEEALGRFLFAHKQTLRNLHIGEAGCTPEESTWKQVLTDLRDHMSLEKFELYDPDSEGRIYDDNWKSLHSDGKSKIKDAKLLELYVLGKCPWPMSDSNPRDSGWKRKFGAEDMKLLDLSEEERRDLLGEDWETDGDSEAEDEDMEDDDSSDNESEAFFSVEEDNSFIDDGNLIAGDGDWEDMEVDEADVVD